jgi:flagellar biosynthesis/type III secretory pathway chaperone
MTPTITPETAILDILAAEHRLYARLLTIAEAKRAALLRADTDALVPLVREMEGIILQVEQLEDERLACVARLADGAVVETISALLPYFSGESRGRIEMLREQLRDDIARLRTVNETNSALVRQALSFSDQWVRLIRAATPGTYAATGMVTAQPAVTRQWQV